MKIGLSTGYYENYWTGWPWAKQYGGSEHILVELASEFASQGHEVTVRLPYDRAETQFRGVRWVGLSHPSMRFDRLFCFDDFQRRDDGGATTLVACRSDPPPHSDFDQLLFLSPTHARLMGHPGRPSVGGGVNLKDYERGLKRTSGLVICTSSPDRCMAAFDIGAQFPKFTFTYKPVAGLPPTTQLSREELVDLQKRARVLIYPLDPRRPSDFFSMAVLESLAAGTPVIVSDADSMVELWGSAAIVLKRPINIAQWTMTVEELLMNKTTWNRMSLAGKRAAEFYDWPRVARRYIAATS